MRVALMRRVYAMRDASARSVRYQCAGASRTAGFDDLAGTIQNASPSNQKIAS